MEALRQAPGESRGVAMGAYTAFLDVALALGSPLLGVVAAARGLNAVFVASAVLVLASAMIVIRFRSRPAIHAVLTRMRSVEP